MKTLDIAILAAAVAGVWFILRGRGESPWHWSQAETAALPAPVDPYSVGDYAP